MNHLRKIGKFLKNNHLSFMYLIIIIIFISLFIAPNFWRRTLGSEAKAIQMAAEGVKDFQELKSEEQKEVLRILKENYDEDLLFEEIDAGKDNFWSWLPWVEETNQGKNSTRFEKQVKESITEFKKSNISNEASINTSDKLATVKKGNNNADK